jgi:DNA polymerase I-like protein with 3'-5' exonuclease and polymerase domains
MNLKDKLALLKVQHSTAQSANIPVPVSTTSVGTGNCLFLGTPEDKEYLPHLKPMFGGKTTYVCLERIELLSHLKMYCDKRGVSSVVSTNTTILRKLLELSGNPKGSPKLSDYQGSFFKYQGLEIVFISPLSQLFTVSYGKFIAGRFISKVISPDTWRSATKFQWEMLTPDNWKGVVNELETAIAIATDIETFRRNLAIRCIGYTGVFLDAVGNITTKSYVLPMDSVWALGLMRTINDLKPDKIFQNGKYDNSYLLRYNAAPRNWFWDTINLAHSYYSELPKDLAFLNAFYLREVVYWKDLAETSDLHEYYKYNALDTWATANVWISQLLQLPDWARHNYTLEFPMVYPCLLSEMTGIQRAMDKIVEARKEFMELETKELKSLRVMVGKEDFNPGSPPQVVKLLKILGCGDITSSNEKDINKAKIRHPLNLRILNSVLNIRGWRKLKSTYLRTDEDAKADGEGGGKELNGTILYALNPHGTDTSRLASREHHFWCGLQIQNIPRDGSVKQTLRAADGFYLGECDLEQAESRDTANISGDENLIAAVSSDKDFHSTNASAFFGVAYESIYDDKIGKTKDKPLRDLAKRVNHGANYNMGPGVLIDTMGLDKIWEAAKLLRLPFTDPKRVAEYLLAQFHKTYPRIKGDYYESVKREIAITRRLTSRAYHHTEYNLRHNKDIKSYIEFGDWSRYCFGSPDRNKSDLNSYVAHCPQSLNARTLNEAYLEVFYNVALRNPATFRLHAQIHDSILFSYLHGFELHAETIRQCMEIPITIRDVSGSYRNFIVPAALKLGKIDKATGELVRAKYWNETE